MTDHTMRRADELLTELVELVETARAVPMSGSCVVPREHTLDLLDELREVLPPEVAEARLLVADRDSIIAQAVAHADALVADATVAADARVAAATEHANQLVDDARADAAGVIDAGKAENARLISSAGVHQAAAEAAERLRAEADEYAAAVRGAADADAFEARSEAEDYSAALRANAEDYAERTLAEIVATLQRSATTAERGRAELAARRSAAPGVGVESGATDHDGPADDPSGPGPVDPAAAAAPDTGN